MVMTRVYIISRLVMLHTISIFTDANFSTYKHMQLIVPFINNTTPSLSTIMTPNNTKENKNNSKREEQQRPATIDLIDRLTTNNHW